MILKLLRNGLGNIIVFIDWLTRPSKMQRTEQEQKAVDQALEGLALYQLYACPFCIKTRRTLHRLNLPVAMKSVAAGSPYRQELEQGGGKIQVPCLRISQNGKDEWMYESSDIIEYLNQRFGNSAKLDQPSS